jgi:hypothetical protein
MNDDHVCVNCFTDKGIREFILSNATERHCSFCGQASRKQIAVKLETLVDHIRYSILREYDEAVNCLPYESAEGGYIGECWDTSELLNDIIGLELPHDDGRLMDSICEGLGQTDWCEADPFGLSDRDHVRYSWSNFCHVVKYERRYFFSAYGERDHEILTPSEVLSKIFENAQAIGLLKFLKERTRFFRVRRQKNGEKLTTIEQLGPPNEEEAKQPNRMSPAGIVMFYVSDNREAALRERVSEPGTYVIAEFEITRPILILDLCKLPSIPSLFEGISDSCEYDPRRVLTFLHHVTKEISRPIERDDRTHIEYVPTQVVTEFIRSQFLSDGTIVEGIKYPSAVHKGFASYVLFATQKNLISSRMKRGELLSEEDRWILLKSKSISRITKKMIDSWL